MKRILHIVYILSIMLLSSSPCSMSAAKHALVFGIGTYKDTSWGKIHGDRDVDYVVQMLRSNGYTDIATLRNEKATKAGMVAAFKALIARCKKNDQVYIHYSGHGQLMTDTNGDEAQKWQGRRHAGWDESWVPYDAYMTYCKQDRGEKHFCDDEIAIYLSMIRERVGAKGEIIVAIDACHSGDATCGEEEECVRGVDIKFNIPLNNASKTAEPIKEQWLTISACQPYQLCMEMKDYNIGKLTYGLFTLNKEIFTLSPSALQQRLTEFINLNKGRLTQTPMVRGKK